jgi:hypothetical protein
MQDMQEVLTGEQAAALWPSVYAAAMHRIPVNTAQLLLIAAVAKLVETAAHHIAEEADRLLANAGVECNILIMRDDQNAQS